MAPSLLLALALGLSAVDGVPTMEAMRTSRHFAGTRPHLMTSKRPAVPKEQVASSTTVKSTLASHTGKKPSFSRNPLRAIGRAAAKRLSVKESAGVAFQRPVTSGPRLTSHDWAKNLWSLLRFKSDILSRISGHLTFNIVLAIIGATWFHMFPEHFLHLGTTGHGLAGAALSLLLVFRTSSAYDRFWEARKILGAVVDNSRGLARVAPTALPPGQATEFGRLIVAFPYMLRIHLTGRGQKPVKDTSDAPDVLPFVDKRQEEVIDSYFSKPFATLSLMNKILAAPQAKYPGESWTKTLEMTPQRLVLQGNVNTLAANVGACERIQGCPVPQQYSRHLSRYLTIWAATLPYVLAPVLQWWSIPVIAAICWSLFSIEEVGHMIEEPFLALPYDQVQTKRVADVIKRDTVNIYKQQLGVDLATREFEDPAKLVAPVPRDIAYN